MGRPLWSTFATPLPPPPPSLFPNDFLFLYFLHELFVSVLISGFRCSVFFIQNYRFLYHGDQKISSPRMPHALGEIFTHAQLLNFKNRNS